MSTRELEDYEEEKGDNAGAMRAPGAGGHQHHMMAFDEDHHGSSGNN